MSKYEQRPFIYNLDLLSGTPGIFISRKKNFRTLLGLITTIIVLILSIIHTLYEVLFYFLGRKITIVELENNFATKQMNVSLNDFLLAFNVFNINSTINYMSDKEINLKSGNITRSPFKKNYTVNLYYENPENKEVINKFQLEIEQCEAGKNINQKLIEKYNFTNYKNYLCLSEKSNHFDLVINKTHNTYIDIIISIEIENSTNYGIKEIYSNEFLTMYELNYLEFQLYSPNDFISDKDLNNPIKYRKNTFNYELFSPGILEHNEIKIQFVDYSSDDGYFLKNNKKFNCLSVGSVTKTTQDLTRFPQIQNLIYSEFRLY